MSEHQSLVNMTYDNSTAPNPVALQVIAKGNSHLLLSFLLTLHHQLYIRSLSLDDLDKTRRLHGNIVCICGWLVSYTSSRSADSLFSFSSNTEETVEVHSAGSRKQKESPSWDVLTSRISLKCSSDYRSHVSYLHFLLSRTDFIFFSFYIKRWVNHNSLMNMNH